MRAAEERRQLTLGRREEEGHRARQQVPRRREQGERRGLGRWHGRCVRITRPKAGGTDTGAGELSDAVRDLASG